MSVTAHRHFVKQTARANKHFRNREEAARSYPPRKPEPWGASTSASPLPPVCWLHEPLPLHGKIRNIRNQGQAESVKPATLRGGRAGEHGDRRARTGGGRGIRISSSSRRCLGRQTRAARAAHGDGARGHGDGQHGGAAERWPTTTTRVWSRSKTRSGGGDTDTNAKIFLGPVMMGLDWIRTKHFGPWVWTAAQMRPKPRRRRKIISKDFAYT